MAGFLVPRRSVVVHRHGTLDSLIPEGHLVRFIWRVLCSIDFNRLEAKYTSVNGGPGRPPYHPRVLCALWIYGMTQGLETAAAVASACQLRDDFRWLAGGLCPSDQTLLNLLASNEELASIFVQVLQAMHRAGHVDLSAIAEDGTKLRANASRRSFHTSQEIDLVIGQLKSEITDRLKQLSEGAQESTAAPSKIKTEVRALQDRLQRAERAARELRERAERREGRQAESSPHAVDSGPASPPVPESADPPRPDRFRSADFRHDAERNLLVCPAGAELRFVGAYGPADGARYQLYRRSDCTTCPLKPQCTSAKGRVVKIPLRSRPLPAESASLGGVPSRTDGAAATEQSDSPQTGPQASLTDPEAVLMLATSEKRWEPSYNADLAVTRHGVITSQFLTKHPTDYHSFAPALAAVSSAVGRPDSWIGDGHYGTQANVLLAHRAGVTLYAPPAGAHEHGANPAATEAVVAVPSAPNLDSSLNATRGRYGPADFRHHAERDILVCPAGEELRMIGTYPTDNGLGRYRLYGRSNCGECALRHQCTDAPGRRVKMPLPCPEAPEKSDVPAGTVSADHGTAPEELPALLQSLRARMDHLGDRVLAFRRQTVEPVNAQLKQHGVGRFHVRGLSRCSAVLSLATIAHNLMKWHGREAAIALRPAA